MDAKQRSTEETESAARSFYRRALDLLNAFGVPYLVGGAYALQRYANVQRATKDFDVFVRKDDCTKILSHFSAQGYKTEITFPHWLGKIFEGEYVVDLIFGSGNGTTEVDDDWFRFAVDEVVIDTPVKLVPAEEMIYSKGFIMERERYDGADVNHVIRSMGSTMDWQRLLTRFGTDWKVLLNHLILFDYVYPSERAQIPSWLVQELLNRYVRESRVPASGERICYGTLLSREQYLKDIREWGYKDPRTIPEDQLALWTNAIDPTH
jgi:hypothetical protein